MSATHDLRHLVYASMASKPMSIDDLTALLDEARSRNEMTGVTGMLLYKNQRFMQLLEGPSDVVKRLYNTISTDSRHINVLKLLYLRVYRRSFSNWSMGFCRLEDNAVIDVGCTGNKRLLELDAESFLNEPLVAQRLMLKFSKDLAS